MRRRVVVTGIGCVTPLGTTVSELWDNLLACKSGVAHTTLFDAASFPTNISAEVRDWSVADVGEDPQVWKDRSRHTCFAAGAAKQAVKDSGVLGTVDPLKFGVYLGAGEGAQDFYRFSKMMTAAVQSGELNLRAFMETGLKELVNAGLGRLDAQSRDLDTGHRARPGGAVASVTRVSRRVLDRRAAGAAQLRGFELHVARLVLRRECRTQDHGTKAHGEGGSESHGIASIQFLAGSSGRPPLRPGVPEGPRKSLRHPRHR